VADAGSSDSRHRPDTVRQGVGPHANGDFERRFALDLDLLGQLLRHQAGRPQERGDLGQRRRDGTGPQGQHRADPLPALGVRQSEHRDLGDRRVLHQQRLQLERRGLS
jgi:hypothetical protein